MKNKELPKRTITFCAVAVLFIGSLYYFVDTAFEQRDALMHKTVHLNLQDLLDDGSRY